MKNAYPTFVVHGLLLAVLGAAPALCAAADAAPAQSTAAEYDFDIPAQPLARAIAQLSTIANLQVLYTHEEPLQIQSNPVRGRYTAEQALRLMLGSSGITYRFIRPGVFTLEKAPSGARLLGPVRVEGQAGQSAGVNGSTDPTATEGTKSYTSGALTVGSKTPQTIRETPQSVSVMTQQRIEDQNLTDLNSALNQASGITLVKHTTIEDYFYSRGFQVTTFQLDGGAPLDLYTFGSYSLPDLAEFDHVEVLRGADGLFGGAGNPSAVVNLQRKRPLDHDQWVATGTAGSFGSYRGELDATGPIGFDGHLRARLVSVTDDHGFFYHTASSKKDFVYAVAEADLTPTTLLTLGSSYQYHDTVPWGFGLPRYSTGANLSLPRSTCLCESWSRWTIGTFELFGSLEQRFGREWRLKVDVTRRKQSIQSKSGDSFGFVDAASGQGPYLLGSADTTDVTQYALDVTLNGGFDVLGRAQNVVVGADYQDASSPFRASNLPDSSVDVFHFQSEPEPATQPVSFAYPDYHQRQYGLYSALHLHPLEHLTLIGGSRVSFYRYDQVYEGFNPDGSVAFSGGQQYEDSAVVTPYGGVVYDLTSIWSLYASFADIYQSQAGNLDASGKPLKPVSGENSEAGIKSAWFDNQLNLTLAAFYIAQRNQAVFDPNSPGGGFSGPNGSSCCYLALGKVTSQGLDAEVTGRLAPGWQLYAGYTYDINKDVTGVNGVPGDTYFSQAPKHLLKAWTSYQLPGRWSPLTLGGGVNAQSSNYVSGSACARTDGAGHCTSPAVPFRFTQESYAILSARGSYQIDPRWQVALNVNNLLNKTYYQTTGSSSYGNWYGEPFNFMVTIRGAF